MVVENRPLLRWQAVAVVNGIQISVPVEIAGPSWFRAREQALCCFAQRGIYIEAEHLVLRTLGPESHGATSHPSR